MDIKRHIFTANNNFNLKEPLAEIIKNTYIWIMNIMNYFVYEYFDYEYFVVLLWWKCRNKF